jgi:hypothetical protein
MEARVAKKSQGTPKRQKQREIGDADKDKIKMGIEENGMENEEGLPHHLPQNLVQTESTGSYEECCAHILRQRARGYKDFGHPENDGYHF